MRPKTKGEVRLEEESSNPLDTGASIRNSPNIRVLNHKDYRTWKVRIPTVYTFSSITGVFESLFVFSEDAAKPKCLCASDKTKEAPYVLMKSGN